MHGSVLSSVRSAIHVIGLFSDETPVLGVTEIARRLNIAKSTASRLSSTLCAEDVLVQTAGGKYQLSVRLVGLGVLAARSHRVYDEGRKALMQVRATTGLGGHLSILDGTELAQICRVTSDYMEQLGMSRPRQPVLATSAGRAILAYSDPSVVERCLHAPRHRFSPALRGSAVETRAMLLAVRTCGYAVSRGDYVADVVGVAVPILSDKGTPVAALTALGNAHQMGDDRVRRIAALLARSAHAISAAVF